MVIRAIAVVALGLLGTSCASGSSEVEPDRLNKIVFSSDRALPPRTEGDG